MLRCSMCKRPIKRGWRWAWRTCCKPCYRTLSQGFRVDHHWRPERRKRQRRPVSSPQSFLDWLFGRG